MHRMVRSERIMIASILHMNVDKESKYLGNIRSDLREFVVDTLLQAG
jgi:hypothetical protein